MSLTLTTLTARLESWHNSINLDSLTGLASGLYIGFGNWRFYDGPIARVAKHWSGSNPVPIKWIRCSPFFYANAGVEVFFGEGLQPMTENLCATCGHDEDIHRWINGGCSRAGCECNKFYRRSNYHPFEPLFKALDEDLRKEADRKNDAFRKEAERRYPFGKSWKRWYDENPRVLDIEAMRAERDSWKTLAAKWEIKARQAEARAEKAEKEFSQARWLIDLDAKTKKALIQRAERAEAQVVEATSHSHSAAKCDRDYDQVCNSLSEMIKERDAARKEAEAVRKVATQYQTERDQLRKDADHYKDKYDEAESRRVCDLHELRKILEDPYRGYLTIPVIDKALAAIKNFIGRKV